jgi:curved DNA-binding protein CbpA
MANDYYAVLQVDPRADPEIIDVAYRKLAAKYHPDVNPAPDSGRRMQQINAAYEVLSDPERRAAYDAGLEMADRPRSRPPAPPLLDLRRFWRNLLVPFIMVLLLAVGSRFGPQAMLFLTVLAVLIAVWLLTPHGKDGRG